jgi:Tol biopolymer transport system component
MAPSGRIRPVTALVALAGVVALVAASIADGAAPTRRVNLSSAEVQANAGSGNPSISGSGRFVVFNSQATNLVPNDTNALSDVFVRDRRTGLTYRVSVATGGAQSNGHSSGPRISSNGRFVVFYSDADNLVPGDDNHRQDIFVRDRKTKHTTRVSVSSTGEQADDGSDRPSISADGRFVVFDSYATNLVPSDTNARSDVFVRDRKNKTTRRMSRGMGGAETNGDSVGCVGYAPGISADGAFVAFASSATNLVPNDTNGAEDVFVRNRKTGLTRRVTVSSAGVQAIAGGSSYCSISGGGGLVVYESDSNNLVPNDTNTETDVFVRNWRDKKTRRVNVTSAGVQSTDWGGYSGISSNGRFVFFQGPDSNLAPRDHNGFDDIYVHDRKTHKTRRATTGTTGASNGNGYGWMSSDGRFLAYESDMLVVAGDTNGEIDILVRGPFAWG